MEMYNVVVDVRTKTDPEDMLDALEGFHPVIAHPHGDQMQVILSLPAEGLEQAVRMGLAVLGLAHQGDKAQVTPLAVQAMTSEAFDRRAGLQPLPELISVPEAAELLGVSRQAVQQRLESGSLAGTKVGSAWVIQRSAVRPPRRPAPR